QEAVLRVLREGIRDGEFRRVDLHDAMWAVIGAVNVAMEVELCHPQQSLGRDGVRRVLDLVLEGIVLDRKANVKNGRKR
ncbi:MAG TPA: hypothetical protein VHM68_03870, partial [Candidatus Deferrimicrobium sp.]|nr:hypothetical protein [Candidatus Deferrimicrobium sp.]